MKKILILSDFKESSENAFNYAADLAQQNDLEVVLLHVVTPEVSKLSQKVVVDGHNADDTAYFSAATNNLSVKALNMLYEKGVNDVEYIVESGDLVECVRNTAIQKEVDLVIMGSHIPDGYSERSGNTNSSALVDNLECPVIVVPEFTRHLTLKNATFATSLLDDQLLAFHVLADFQRQLGLEVDVLYLNDPAHVYEHDGIRERINHLSAGNGLKVNKIYTSIHADDVQKQIDTFVNDNHTDMLVMVAHKRKGFMRWILGSRTEKSLNHARVPVLIFDPALLEG